MGPRVTSVANILKKVQKSRIREDLMRAWKLLWDQSYLKDGIRVIHAPYREEFGFRPNVVSDLKAAGVLSFHKGAGAGPSKLYAIIQFPDEKISKKRTASKRTIFPKGKEAKETKMVLDGIPPNALKSLALTMDQDSAKVARLVALTTADPVHYAVFSTYKKDCERNPEKSASELVTSTVAKCRYTPKQCHRSLEIVAGVMGVKVPNYTPRSDIARAIEKVNLTVDSILGREDRTLAEAYSNLTPRKREVYHSFILRNPEKSSLEEIRDKGGLEGTLNDFVPNKAHNRSAQNILYQLQKSGLVVSTTPGKTKYRTFMVKVPGNVDLEKLFGVRVPKKRVEEVEVEGIESLGGLDPKTLRKLRSLGLINLDQLREKLGMLRKEMSDLESVIDLLSQD